MKFKLTRYIIYLMAAGCLGSVGTNAQTIPTPPQTDQISQDKNSNGKADPGDKIRCKVTVQNTGQHQHWQGWHANRRSADC